MEFNDLSETNNKNEAWGS